MILEIFLPTDYSDHTLITWIFGGVIAILLVMAAFFLGSLHSEHKELVNEHKTHADNRKTQMKQHTTLWENHLKNEVIQINNKKEMDDFKKEVLEKIDSLETLITKETKSNIAINSAAMEILFKIEKKIDH